MQGWEVETGISSPRRWFPTENMIINPAQSTMNAVKEKPGMAERSKDWMWQAERDLNHARNSLSAEDFEWACFAGQQAAEKALKAVFQAKHLEGWGNVLIKLAEDLKPHASEVSEEILEACRNLDKFYIPTRYPNGFASGAPGQFYDAKDAQGAIRYAGIIIEFCKDQIL